MATIINGSDNFNTNNVVTDTELNSEIGSLVNTYVSKTGSDTSYYKSMTASANVWTTVFTHQDSVLSTGVYIFKVYIADVGYGGSSYYETYASSPFYWYASGTNSGAADTIDTHKMGHASNSSHYQFRTLRTGGNSGTQAFQLYTPDAVTSPYPYTFYFKRIF